jgi:YVTN family beta-propeller protein
MRPGPRPFLPLAAIAALLVVVVAGVAIGKPFRGEAESGAAPRDATAAAQDSAGEEREPAGADAASGGEIAPVEQGGVYAAATSTDLDPKLEGIRERVYVPNSDAGTLTVIDPKTKQVLREHQVGQIPHHVTPSWDLEHLWVNNTGSNTLTRISPKTGKPTKTIPVHDPYNLYFTPDGSKAIVVAEREKRLDFRDPDSWELIKSVSIPWPGVDHLDFSADGRYLMASTEFSGQVVRVNVETMRITGRVEVGGLPIDVKVSPDGRHFYVANQGRHGVSVISAGKLKEVDFIPTGEGAHGLHVSRDAKELYVSNRLAGSISVIDLATRKLSKTWKVGGSPDMLQISIDGSEIWVSSRFHAGVMVIDSRSGRLKNTIQTGAGAHGVSYFPQPGRYNVGHNGVYR